MNSRPAATLRRSPILRALLLASAAAPAATCGGGSGGGGILAPAGPTVVKLAAGPDLEFRAQEALVGLSANSIVELPAGRFDIRSELIVAAPHVTIRGQGMDKTILSFRNQDSGAQGIHGMADVFTVEDLTIEDTPGDGVKVEGVDHVTFRRVKVIWTGGPSAFNGAYGLYPVQCTNVLVEDCFVSGASDAGIYVGQSENIVVRRSTAEFNVAGIEIENSVFADVYENLATNNTGGVLVFDLPNLPKQGGRQTRVFDNRIVENNTPNFAPEGNIVGLVPAGTGLMIMANDDIEVMDNEIAGNETAPIVVISYLTTGNAITDPNYDPIPTRLNIHDNTIDKETAFSPDDGQFGILLNILFLFLGGIPDMIYDGTLGEDFPDGLPPGERICIRDNAGSDGKPATFANLHLEATDLGIPLPSEPVSFDLSPHDCAYDPLPAIALEAPPAPPPPGGDANPVHLCAAPGAGPNFAAAEADCPTLADYRLFLDPTEPRRNPNAPGIPFDLTTPLFSDYASKHRFVFLPPGTKAVYDASKTFAFPVGTIIAKTFGFQQDLRTPNAATERVVETRLLLHRADGWVGRAYIWNDARTEARLALGGGRRDVSFVDFAGATRQGNYDVPNANQCAGCHFNALSGDGTAPIGPKARYLNRDLDYPGEGPENQIRHWIEAGALQGGPADPAAAPRVPVWNDPSDGTLEARARGYLEINCAHCHNAEGRARFSGLFLNIEQPLSTALGICKPPTAAGRGAGNLRFDIVPGEPDESILAFRMASAEPGIEMPELAKGLVHNEGVALVADWIASLDGGCAP